MSEKNIPAFPEVYTDFNGATGRYDVYSAGGMTLRDWFAGQALMGLMNTPGAVGVNKLTITNISYDLADAMLAAREVKHD